MAEYTKDEGAGGLNTAGAVADTDVYPVKQTGSIQLLSRTWAVIKAAIKTYYDSVTSTLTNKTISGADNTLTNIGNSSLTNSSITVNGSPVSLGGSVTVQPQLDGTGFVKASGTTITYDNSTYVTASSSTAFTNKTGLITQWTNDANYLTPSSTNTVTNKRFTERVESVSNQTTWAINVDNYDVFENTGLTGAVTVSNPTGTPTNYQTVILLFKDNGTARAISFGSAFASNNATLPSTTTISKELIAMFVYLTITGKYECMFVKSKP